MADQKIGGTKLYVITREKVKRLRDKIIKEKVEPWRWLRTRHGVHITKHDGGAIGIVGVEYSGSVPLVFWSGYIEPFLKDGIDTILSETAKTCIDSGLDAEIYIKEAAMVLEGFIWDVYDRMVDIDRNLRGKGYPDKVRRRDVTFEIERMRKYIEERCDAEVFLAEAKQGKQQYKEFSVEIASSVKAVIKQLQDWSGDFLPDKAAEGAIRLIDIAGDKPLKEVVDWLERNHHNREAEKIKVEHSKIIKWAGSGVGVFTQNLDENPFATDERQSYVKLIDVLQDIKTTFAQAEAKRATEGQRQTQKQIPKEFTGEAAWEKFLELCRPVISNKPFSDQPKIKLVLGKDKPPKDYSELLNQDERELLKKAVPELSDAGVEAVLRRVYLMGDDRIRKLTLKQIFALCKDYVRAQQKQGDTGGGKAGGGKDRVKKPKPLPTKEAIEHSLPLGMKRWALIFDISVNKLRQLRDDIRDDKIYHFRKVSPRLWTLPKSELPAEYLEKYRQAISQTHPKAQ
jgi:hypothetical protein